MRVTRTSVGKHVRETSTHLDLPHVVVPVLVAMVLAAPCLNFPFLWDDFDFLGRGLHLRLADLLPDRQTIFYRPLSRELYFGLLDRLGASPLIGHLLNSIGLVTIVCLLYSVVRRIAGARAGFFAGIVFSGLSALPLLVGWVSGIQDIMAIALLLASILMELNGRRAIALTCFAGALLSKETTLALLPGVLVAGSIQSGRRWPTTAQLVSYGALCAAWAAIHPGVRLLIAGGLQGGGGGYLTSPSLAKVKDFNNGLLTLLNIPLGSGAVGALRQLAIPFVLALSLAWTVLALFRRAPRQSQTAVHVNWFLTIALAALVILPPLLLTSLLVQNWSPYYACMPALGLATLAGIWLSKARTETACLLVSAYLGLGVWSRTVAMAPTVTTEMNLRATGSALTTVERNFKMLRPRFSEDSHIYVSAQLRGPTGVYHHLFRYQPLRIWYREPSLFVLDPNRYRSGGRRDYLFWINQNFEVFEIDLRTLAPRTTGPLPDAFAYQKTLRTFALGRAAAGKVDEAVRILLTMPGRPLKVVVYDTRAAAALLFASGRQFDADSILKGVAAFDREESLDAVLAILAEPIPGLDLDDGAMWAFGIPPNDLEANRALMQGFVQFGFSDAALRFAKRTLSLNPQDADALAVLRKLSGSGVQPQVTVPIPHD